IPYIRTEKVNSKIRPVKAALREQRVILKLAVHSCDRMDCRLQAFRIRVSDVDGPVSKVLIDMPDGLPVLRSGDAAQQRPAGTEADRGQPSPHDKLIHLGDRRLKFFQYQRVIFPRSGKFYPENARTVRLELAFLDELQVRSGTSEQITQELPDFNGSGLGVSFKQMIESVQHLGALLQLSNISSFPAGETYRLCQARFIRFQITHRLCKEFVLVEDEPRGGPGDIVDQPEDHSAFGQPFCLEHVGKGERSVRLLAICRQVGADGPSRKLTEIRCGDTPPCQFPVEDKQREAGRIAADAHVLTDKITMHT